jgi:hypothetical protein
VRHQPCQKGAGTVTNDVNAFGIQIILTA